MSRRLAWVALVLGLCAPSACSLITSFDGFDDGAADAAVTSSSDAGSGDRTEGGCPVGLPGPAMVRVGTFCIDSTEITVDHYMKFLGAAGSAPGEQPDACAWNTTTTPKGWPPPGSLAQAFNGANWCQAYLYCSWAGKRLCGNPDGGPTDPATPDLASASQWFQACSHDDDGQHVYPYGNTYEPTVCNGGDPDGGHALPSSPTCQGGYPGIFDMSGNVWEWEDSCTPDPDPSGFHDQCSIRGGAYWSPSSQLVCVRQATTDRGDQGQLDDLGIRCCSK